MKPFGSISVTVVALAALLTGRCPAVAAPSFEFKEVVARAEKLAQGSFDDSAGKVPDWMLKMSYDQWRDIRFRPERSLWRKDGLPFEVQFFHPGLLYDRAVPINIVDAGRSRAVEFSPSQFDYGHNSFASQVPQDLGYAGLRVHFPIKKASYKDEVLVFLGASYFRAVGRDQQYGLSARALAVDTGSSSGEEFPYFREFWLLKPSPGARSLTLFALLDSKSVTGAYKFVITPGGQTTMQVEARLFVRRAVEKLGIAPLTSMFFHGENTSRRFDDFRPEVHDSDGLLLQTSAGEWIWRPLDNPDRLHVSAPQASNPKGFGLLQRDRRFASYEDLEARSELRPSTWIAPKGAWGDGTIELIEIPTKSDVNDNIVAFWRPTTEAKAGDRFIFTYTLSWFGDDATRPPDGRVTATRHDYGTHEDAHRFVVDFEGKKLATIPDNQVLRAVLSIASGPDSADLLEQQVVKNPVTQGWRLTFQVHPKSKAPVELRAFLDSGGDTLTETWSYAVQP